MPKILLPTIVGLAVYLIINKLFPEKGKVFQNDPVEDLKGGSRIELASRIAKKLLKDKSLKIALVSIFATVSIQYLQSDIEELLVERVFKHLCLERVGDKLEVVSDIVQEHELGLHAKSMKLLILSDNIDREEKITLLKIKLDFLINGEGWGEKRFLIMAILAAVIAVTVSGVGGITLILEALYRLFKEGRISKRFYEQTLKFLGKKLGIKVPTEHILD